MGLYTIGEYRGAFEAADLTVEHTETGLIDRGLFVGQRR
jgi:hypothetical protein